MTSSPEDDRAPAAANSEKLDAARDRYRELLARYESLLDTATQKSGPEPLPRGEAIRNRILLFGVPLASAGAALYFTGSWLWTVAALVGGLIAVIALMLIIIPDATPRPGTEGFEAEQEVRLIHRFVQDLLDEPPEPRDLDSVERDNRALEHYIEELEARIPKLRSMAKGENSISVQRHHED